jgi:SAM-dependent methyltransferase
MVEHATQSTERWQVDTTAAEVYEEMFVPALFRDAAEHLVTEATLGSGERVLDIGCGTGIVARLADDSFDVVLSQVALMFFTDRDRAIREMGRVVRPGGRILVAVWESLDRNPTFDSLSKLAEARFGDEVASVLRAPFTLGDPGPLLAAFRQAGAADASARTVPHTARFPSVRSWLYMESKGSPIGAMLDDEALESFLDELEPRFAHLAQGDGSARIELSALTIKVTARANSSPESGEHQARNNLNKTGLRIGFDEDDAFDDETVRVTFWRAETGDLANTAFAGVAGLAVSAATTYAPRRILFNAVAPGIRVTVPDAPHTPRRPWRRFAIRLLATHACGPSRRRQPLPGRGGAAPA